MVYYNDPSVSVSGNLDIRDRRARLSPKPASITRVLGQKGEDNILSPLIDTNGLLWPYTPVITDSNSVNYTEFDMVHSNQPMVAYKNNALKEIQISGTFTAQNESEARYCLAVIHFLRTVTKMYFGASGNNSATQLRGTPPPVLLFNAYGTALYHNVPVLVRQFSVEFPNDVDYVEVPSPVDGTSAWVPAEFLVITQLIVQNSPKRLRQFNLDSFRKGDLIKKGGWL